MNGAESDTVLTSLEESRPHRGVVTIGTFDGVHRGHHHLLRSALIRARELDVAVSAITFEPVPGSVLRPDLFAGRICRADEKIERLQRAGLDHIVVLTFDRALAQLSPETFMGRVKVATGLRELWIGEAFALGRDRVGDVPRLTAIGRDLGFEVVAVPRLTHGDDVISSSAIRRAVMDGDVARAERFLGVPFRVSGEVIHGAHLGRTIGYPTANFVPPASLVPLADGIYASQARLPDGRGPRPAMTYVGTRPTVNSGDRLIETHLLDFTADLYGLVIDVDMRERLRGDRTFAGMDELIAQMRQDEAATRAALARIGANAPAEN